jgi:ABC-type sugar transport system substrate-binding protein
VKPSVALLLQTLGNDYQELLRDDCLAAARRFGFEVSVHSAEHSPERQLQQVRELMRQPEGLRPVAVLISPVRETTLMAAAHEAVRMGLGWVVLSRWSEYLAEQHQLFPKVPLFCVMPDQQEIGRIQARQVKALMPDGAELLYIRGPLGTFSAERRWAGFQEEFDTELVRPF